MTPDGILETCLYVPDIDQAATFYHEVLGLEQITKDSERLVFFRCGDQVFLIFNPDASTDPPAPGSLPVPPHGAHGQGHVCFRATGDDLDRWRARLVDHGVAIESEFEWPQGGRSIYFRDPAGNCLEFAEPRIWGITER